MMRALGFILLLFPLLGCSPEAADAPAPGVIAETSDPQSRTHLAVHAPRERIGVAERLALRVELTWDPEASVELLAPEWESTDWTLIDMIAQPPVATGSGLVREARTYVIEPFLPGAYAVPAFGVRVADTPAGTARLRTEPIEIEVVSVLADAGGEELRPPAEPLAPEPEDQPAGDTGALIVVSVPVVLVCSVAAVLLLTRKKAPEPIASVHARLTEIAGGGSSDPKEDYRALQRTFERLDPRLHRTSEFRQLIHTCERAAFAPASTASPAPDEIARHALALLGDDGEGVTA